MAFNEIAATNQKPAPETPASMALGELGGAVSALQERMEGLIDRLHAVLVPPEPSPAEKSEPQAGSPIPIVDSIMRQTLRINRVIALCDDVIQRAGV